MQHSSTNIEYLEHVMKLGFDRAARSFAKFLGAQTKNGMTPAAFSVDHISESIPKHADDQVYVLITQVIGDFTGKSYLIFSEAESKTLLDRIKPRSQDSQYREAVMLEIDNIISASFIAELADALGAEIYGDIPQLKKMASDEVEKFIHADWENIDPSKLVFAQTRFEVENTNLHPAFIWQLSPKMLERIPNSKLAS
jgi:chemotaxis protein CheY-P-specific phosphatase CheC